MYNDTITAANKIISDRDLEEIFQRMDAEMRENIQLCKQETIQNERYEREYQHWTVKDFQGTFKCTINFYDATTVTVDNYDSFIGLFNSRIQEIKTMWLTYRISYWIQDGNKSDLISQSISMNIWEDRINVDVSLSSDDDKMNDIYELIKNKILQAPEKYDKVIKKKTIIVNKYILALGLIPAIIICTLLAFVPSILEVYQSTYIIYPIAVLLFGFIIGRTIFGGKMDHLYSTITPKQKYVGMNQSTYKSVYKDDIDDYTSSSEIIIGKNINNLNNRKEIIELDKKYSGFIPIELIVILVLSVALVLISFIE